MLIVFTANDRVSYMQQVLDSWSQVIGIDRTDVIVRCEPGHPDMVDLVSHWQAPRSVTVHVNDVNLGPLSNPHRALADGFDLDDFVIVAEDDSIVANDTLAYFAYCATRHEDDGDILAVCAFQHRWTHPDPATYRRRSWFAPTIWGTWASRWHELDSTWDHDYSTETNGKDGGWDCNIGLRVLGDRHCLFPDQSRSQHIGQYGGVHMTADLFDDHQSDCFHPTYPPVNYQERT